MRKGSGHQGCDAPGCQRAHRAKGYCDSHYKRWVRFGDLEDHTPKRQPCSIEGCESLAKAHGWCNKHYQRWVKYGNPTEIHTPVKQSCTYGDCREPMVGNGLCRVHYDRARNGRPMEGREVRAKCALCPKAHHTQGLCQMHYRRLQKWGDPFFDGQTYPECGVEGCPEKPAKRRHLCRHHLASLKKYGDVHGSPDRVNPIGVDLDFEPLARLIESLGGVAPICNRAGPDYDVDSDGRARVEKNLKRAHERGTIDLAVADDLCCKVLRLHPALIWTEDYWTAGIEDEDEELMAA